MAALVLAGVALALAPAASAQSADPPSSRVEIGAGALWIGRQPLGQKSATETTAAGGAGISARAGVRVTRSLVVEADASYLKPQLRIALAGDSEGAAAITAAET